MGLICCAEEKPNAINFKKKEPPKQTLQDEDVNFGARIDWD